MYHIVLIRINFILYVGRRRIAGLLTELGFATSSFHVLGALHIAKNQKGHDNHIISHLKDKSDEKNIYAPIGPRNANVR